jgi:hypothetical protein
MARVSIYVPDELKTRMDAAGDLNWSAAAQRAFEFEINSQRWKMETDVIEKTAARLRASKLEEEGQLKNEGREAGREWAQDDADYRALKTVAEYEWTDDPDLYGFTLCTLILDEEGPSHLEVKEFWETLLGDPRGREPDAAWVDGFIDGAKEVWDEVAEKI